MGRKTPLKTMLLTTFVSVAALAMSGCVSDMDDSTVFVDAGETTAIQGDTIDTAAHSVEEFIISNPDCWSEKGITISLDKNDDVLTKSCYAPLNMELKGYMIMESLDPIEVSINMKGDFKISKVSDDSWEETEGKELYNSKKVLSNNSDENHENSIPNG